jgi:hypothetical protein
MTVEEMLLAIQAALPEHKRGSIWLRPRSLQNHSEWEVIVHHQFAIGADTFPGPTITAAVTRAYEEIAKAAREAAGPRRRK